jgi:hypothetical protein
MIKLAYWKKSVKNIEQIKTPPGEQVGFKKYKVLKADQPRVSSIILRISPFKVPEDVTSSCLSFMVMENFIIF